MTPEDRKLLKAAVLIVGTVNHIRLVKQHKQSCKDCLPLDELEIALDFIHLYGLYGD
jgi:hypothetical protein